MFSNYLCAQELYIYTEPASNVPAKSISPKLSANFSYVDQGHRIGWLQRLKPEVYVGLSKKLMMKGGVTFANMNTNDFKYESISLYGKYRFLSKDDLYKHFRMAIFADAAATSRTSTYEEISLNGDRTGVEAGIVATQLLRRLAISGSLSHTQTFDKSRYNTADFHHERPYESLNYSFSAGYLLFPMNYENYNQTNVNIYTEFLAQQTLDKKRYYIDMAPGVQFIFNSNSKLNLGYRFQLNGDMRRMSVNGFLLSFERTFFGAL